MRCARLGFCPALSLSLRRLSHPHGGVVIIYYILSAILRDDSSVCCCWAPCSKPLSVALAVGFCCCFRLGMFNLIPSHIVCGLGIAGIGTLPYGLRWLVEGEVRQLRLLRHVFVPVQYRANADCVVPFHVLGVRRLGGRTCSSYSWRKSRG